MRDEHLVVWHDVNIAATIDVVAHTERVGQRPTMVVDVLSGRGGSFRTSRSRTSDSPRCVKEGRALARFRLLEADRHDAQVLPQPFDPPFNRPNDGTASVDPRLRALLRLKGREPERCGATPSFFPEARP